MNHEWGWCAMCLKKSWDMSTRVLWFEPRGLCWGCAQGIIPANAQREKRRDSEPADFWTHFKLLENPPKECMKILSKLYCSNSAHKSEVTKSYNPIHNYNNLRVKSPLHYALKSGACFAIIQFLRHWFWRYRHRHIYSPKAGWPSLWQGKQIMCILGIHESHGHEWRLGREEGAGEKWQI